MATTTTSYKISATNLVNQKDVTITIANPVEDIDAATLAGAQSAFSDVGYAIKSGYYYTVEKGDVVKPAA